jgi:hypothetical protein
MQSKHIIGDFEVFFVGAKTFTQGGGGGGGNFLRHPLLELTPV